MMKLGLPEGAVRHKMMADGISAKIQDSVIAGEVAAPTSGRGSGGGGGASGPVSSLSPDEEQIATQYRKMVKLKMPEGAVIHKMNMDGVSQKIQDSVLKGEVPASHPGVSAGAAASALPVNPMAAALKSSGGIGGLKKAEPGEKGEAPVSAPSGNPLLAALAASGGKSALKATPTKQQAPAPASAASGNPLLAALAASGGQSGLKKASPNKQTAPAPAPAPSGNPLLAALAASGGKNGLKKASTNKPPPKQNSSDSLADELAAMGFASRLKKTPQKENRIPPSTASPSGDPELAKALENRKAHSTAVAGPTTNNQQQRQAPPSITTSPNAELTTSLERQQTNATSSSASQIDAIRERKRQQEELATSARSAPRPVQASPDKVPAPPASRQETDVTPVLVPQVPEPLAQGHVAPEPEIRTPAPPAAKMPPTPPAAHAAVPSLFYNKPSPQSKPAPTPAAPEANRQVPTATKTEKVTNLGNGKQLLEVATTTKTTTVGGLQSETHKRERKKKTKNSDKKKAPSYDEGVDHHCQCVIM
jgi:hypothetical protein